MKKYLSILLTALLVFSLFACGGTEYEKFGTPKNGIFDAPEEFYLEWDIASVRDVSVEKEGHYSMPVYMFETYEELLHLKEIVGMDEIGSEIDNTDYCDICYSYDPCDHDKYNEEFFENFTLLIGWHQYAGVIIGEHVQQEIENDENSDTEDPSTSENDAENPPSDDLPNGSQDDSQDEPQDEPKKSVTVAKYEIAPDGALVVYLQGQKADTDTTTQQWVLVAVPKNVIADCDSIAFFVALPTEE